MNTDPTAPSDPIVEDIEAAPVVAAAGPPQPTGENCGNCGAPLFGEHCYNCGQPDHGLVRHFSSVMGDFADTVLQIDTRLTRTLAPLLLRPGYLSREYFAGRRVRYVSPVRLFFFISVVAFFVAQWSVNANGGGRIVQMDKNSITSATTVEEVEHQRDAALKGMNVGEQAASNVPGVARDLDKAEAKLRKEADARIAEINAAKAAGKPPPDHSDPLTFGDNDKPWDPVTHPIKVDSLPDFANRWLNQLAGQTRGNLERIRQDPTVLLDAWLSAVPSTLFVLLPLFALLLKLAYFFKRRLYMEHFIVALHSHAFLCFALLLALVFSGMADVAPQKWLRAILDLAEAAIIVWMPIYLWLMQKRVYAQGWIMTTLKFWMIGTVYVVLLSLGAAVSLLVKLVWL
ncbi:MAG TPA: DUF3667 domain-containing protein [Xanthomonadaceae bacterium]|jgi:hypothetical protein